MVESECCVPPRVSWLKIFTFFLCGVLVSFVELSNCRWCDTDDYRSQLTRGTYLLFYSVIGSFRSLTLWICVHFQANDTRIEIGGVECPFIRGSGLPSGSEFKCTCPEGTGSKKPVVIFTRGETSTKSLLELKAFVSYRGPSIERISGCDSPLGAIQAQNCFKSGNQSVIIYGSDFGKGKASILLGGRLVVGASHSATQPHEVMMVVYLVSCTVCLLNECC